MLRMVLGNLDAHRGQEKKMKKSYIRKTATPEVVTTSLHSTLTWLEKDGARCPVVEGAVNLDCFLEPAARQALEGMIFASGTDLDRVYRTSRTGYGDNEISIDMAEEQIPVIGSFAIEFNAWVLALAKKLFGETAELERHLYQVRLLTPKSAGHSRHVDYAGGADVIRDAGGDYVLCPLSFSLPISMGEGVAPVFVMETESGEVRQDRPGSLAVFGPRIFHHHPPTDGIKEGYLWMVTVAYIKLPLA